MPLDDALAKLDLGDDGGVVAGLVAAPPEGMLDDDDAPFRDQAHALLCAAIVTAGRADLKAAFGAIARALRQRSSQLSDYDYARACHLWGYASWRVDQRIDRATAELNRSIGELAAVGTPAAKRYLGRVHDTFGQLLQFQGQLQDARGELELALVTREADDDEIGVAVTLGNLGRLCMDLGDYLAAAQHLGRDLEIIERRSPELTRLRAQLLSHLGTCALELEQFDVAAARFHASLDVAERDGNLAGVAFARVGLAKVALRAEIRGLERAGAGAEPHLRAAERALVQGTLPTSLRAAIDAEIQLVTGRIHMGAREHAQAVAAFARARQQHVTSHHASPVELAALLLDYAQAQRAEGSAHAPGLLREALRLTDGTAAHQLRQHIEGELEAHYRDSWLLHAAGRFIGQSQIDRILEETGAAGFRGRRADVCVLFSDIRGFTSFSEQLEPEALIELLNDYLGQMTRCVDHFGGWVDKFIGDAVMALYTLPEPHGDDADRAACSALMMRSELERFNRKLGRDLAIGIGLHFGTVVAGLIGSPQKRSYTVIGDTVNTASRIEGMTKALGASILVTEAFCAQLRDRDAYLLRPLGAYRPKGRGGAVTVFDLMGENDRGRIAERLAPELAAATAACELVRAGDLAAAQAAYATLAHDGREPARARGYDFIRRQLAAMIAADVRPAADWDGAITLTEK